MSGAEGRKEVKAESLKVWSRDGQREAQRAGGSREGLFPESAFSRMFLFLLLCGLDDDPQT